MNFYNTPEEDISNLYFECHVTIQPIFEERLELASSLATKYNFKVAKLLMQKRASDTPELSMYDTFITGHSKSLQDIKARMTWLIRGLQFSGFSVTRYKIENTVLDSRSDDIFDLL